MASNTALCIVFVTLFAPCVSDSLNVESDSGANPIRRVVTMLQAMSRKIEQEGEEEQVMFDKYMCYCKNSKATMEEQISTATTKVPQIQGDIEKTQSELKSTIEDKKSNEEDLKSAKTALAEASSNRQKESKEYLSEKGALEDYIEALSRAIPAIEKGAGAFLQTTTGAMLRQAVKASQKVTDYDRDMVMSFLSGSATADKKADGSTYDAGSDEIVGILKQISDDFSGNLEQLNADEEKAASQYSELTSAKLKEVRSLTDTLERQTVRIGDLRVAAVTLGDDLRETQASLKEDKKLSASLDRACAAKPKEFGERKKARAIELSAISETIKILNDDDALDLFKRALPSASLLQFEKSTQSMQEQARAIISSLPKDSRLNFISLALTSKKADFSQVIKMINEMVAALKQEQTAETNKRSYCKKTIVENGDKITFVKQEVEDATQVIASHAEDISQVQEEIEQLKAGIASLDSSVAVATEQRKGEHADFAGLVTQNAAAKQLLKLAETRLQKFYRPQDYAATTSPAPSLLQMSETLAEVVRHKQPTLEAEPAGFKEFKTKGQQSVGVLEILSSLIGDLDREVDQATVVENDAQKEYEETMTDAAEKRSADLQTIATKESAMADLETSKAAADQLQKGKQHSLEAIQQYLAETHQECDWMLSHFDERKKAREEEIVSVKNAKMVLEGADFSLVQNKANGQHGHLRGH